MHRGSLKFNPPSQGPANTVEDTFDSRAPMSIGPDQKPPKVLVQGGSTATTNKIEIDESNEELAQLMNEC